MNHTYRLVWNEASQSYVPAAEGTRARKKSGGRKALVVAAASLGSAFIGSAYAGPTGGEVVAGQASIDQSGVTTTISQQSQNVSLDWQQFNVAANETVQFVQPSSTSIALNRVIGNDASQIFGQLSANGRVFLINPNGVLFGQSAQVNVGGLVASTLDISDADFLAGRYRFASNSATPASVVNEGTITAASGGSVALLGGQVSNQGTISAQLGTVALAAGSAVSLDFSGQQLMNVRVDTATLGALASNQQLIQADGGTVIMTAAARDALLSTVVNNTGVIEAHTAQSRGGVIKLLGSFDGGTVNVGGTLDASAPDGGNGGFVETSGAHVAVANTAHVTTSAPQGSTGTWLIDPSDFTIGAGGNIDGAAMSATLQNANVIIETMDDGNPGNGDINVNDAITWSSDNTLVLRAIGSVNVDAAITNTSSPVLGGVILRADSAGACVAGASACGTINFTGTGHITAANVSLYYNPSGSNAAANPNGIGPSYVTPTDYSANVTGTLNAYMLVNDVNQLQAIDTNRGGSYALGRDIDASATAAWNGGLGFDPIGVGSGAPFIGVFDGLGHTISDLTIARPSESYVGLFSSNGGGTIRNVNLLGATIVGNNFVGGLMGLNGGTVIDVSVDGSVTGRNSVGGLAGTNGGTVMFASASVAVTSNGQNAGGLVGDNTATVSESSATGAVIGIQYVGGLVGLNRGTGDVTTSFATGAVEGERRVGGLVGDNAGVLSDSYATGEVTGDQWVGGFAGRNSGAISDASASGQVSGANTVGGLVGLNTGIASSAYATGAVTGTGSAIGGLVGRNESSVVDVYASGSVSGDFEVGGLVGMNQGTILTAYATGAVTANESAGGLAGSNYLGGMIIEAHATGSASADRRVGGLLGVNNGTVSDSYSTAAVNGVFAVGGLIGMNGGGTAVDNSWYNVDQTTINGAHAVTRSALYDNQFQDWLANGLALDIDDYLDSSGGHYLIGNLQDLQNLLGFSRTSGYSFQLTADIDLAGASGFFIPEFFADRFDGAGHTLANLNVNVPYASQTGLFGNVGGASTIANVNLTGATVSGTEGVGALVGRNQGTIISSSATGSVGGESLVGGLVGLNEGSVFDSHATAAVAGTTYLGGLIGSNSGSGLVDNSWYNVDRSSINGEHIVSMGALYDRQFQDWFANGRVLDVDDYFASSGGNYLIGSVQDLKNLLAFVQIGGYSFQLTADIDLSSAPGWYIPEFTAAQFDGAGHTLSNLSIDLPYAAQVGLFGHVGSGSTITNVNLTGVTIAGFSSVGALAGWNEGTIDGASATASINGPYFAGGLVGMNNGSIANAHTEGSVTGSDEVGGLIGMNYGTVTQSSSNATVTGVYAVGGLIGASLTDRNTLGVTSVYATGSVTGDSGVGGLIGYHDGGLADAYATGSVNGVFSVGGLLGTNDGIVVDVYAAASVRGVDSVGGLVGSNYNQVVDAYATGSVDGDANVGGLVGYNMGLARRTYSSGQVSGTDASTTGGLVGYDSGGDIEDSYWDVTTSTQATSAGGTGLTTAQFMSQSNFVGFNFLDAWYMVEGSTRPFLFSEYSTTITNAHELQLMALDMNGSYVLANDIDMSELTRASGIWSTSSGFVPIGRVGNEFYGNFDGANHAIVDLFINRPNTNYVGLFGVLESGGSVANVGLIGGSVTGRNYTAPLVANNQGTLTNVYSSTSVHGGAAVGGLAGANFGVIGDAYATGAVYGADLAGGLLGFNFGTIERAYSTGLVTGASLMVGGLLAINNGSISDSFWNIETSGQIDLFDGSGIGKTTEEMHDAATFSSWGSQIAAVGGSSATWRIYDGDTGPLLRSFLTGVTVNVDNVSATYNGAQQTFNATYDATGLDPSRIFANTATYRNAGSYSLGGLLYSGQQGYDISYAGGTLDIARASLTIGTNDVIKTYDGTSNANGTAVLLGGTLFGTDSFSGGTFAFADRNAGAGDRTVITSGVTVNDGNGGGNYNVSYADNTTSTIERATLAYTATAPDKVYDGTTAANVTLSGLTGLVGNETLVVTGTGTFNSRDVATANTVTVNTVSLANGSNGGLASNYTISAGATAGAHITPASLTITANNQTRAAGASNPELTLSYTGFVAGEGAANLTTRPVASTAADLNSLPGSYAITASGAVSSNYAFTYVPGMLTVRQAQLPGYPETLSYLDDLGRNASPEAWHTLDLDAEKKRLKSKHPVLDVRGTGIALPPGVQ